MSDTDRVLEEGSVYFFYRPRVEEEDPEDLEDVQNLLMVLDPDDRGESRVTVVGRKRLPDPEREGEDRLWGFVDALADAPDLASRLSGDRYRTETRGERRQPGVRPAGLGRYVLALHGDHTHLAYELKTPEEGDDVQEQLGIAEEASYVLAVKNPDAPSPAEAGLPEEETADYPAELQERFQGLRWIPADPPDLLDFPGAEFVLIAADEDPEEELRVEIDPGGAAWPSGLLDELREEVEADVEEPLEEGEWA